MDPFLVNGFQWYLSNNGGPNDIGFLPKKKYADIGAIAAWTIANGGTNVRVAVIEGDFYLHPDFVGNVDTIWRYDPTNLNNPPSHTVFTPPIVNFAPAPDAQKRATRFSHGTSVASTIAAQINGSGGQGVAYDCDLILIQVDPNFNAAFIIQGIYDACSFNADVINMSFGGEKFKDIVSFPEEVQAYEFATFYGRNGRGTILTNAISNENFNKILKTKRLIKIGRSTPNDQIDGSAFGPELDFLAPGTDLISANKDTSAYTFPFSTRFDKPAPNDIQNSGNHWSGLHGTSGATPIVSGIIALILQTNPYLTWVEVRKVLRKTAHKIDIENRVNDFKWKDKNENDIVDSDGKLIFQSGSTTLFSSVTNPVSESVRDTILDVNDVTGFSIGQAILVGAQAKIVSINDQYTFQVDDASSFEAGHQITVGTRTASTAVQTFTTFKGFVLRYYDQTETVFAVPQDTIRLKSNSGFLPDQKVSIEGMDKNPDSNDEWTSSRIRTEPLKIIQSVDADGHNIKLTTIRSFEYQKQAVVKVLGIEEPLLISAVNGNTITLDSSTPIADTSAHPAGTRVEIYGTEIVFVKDINVGNNTLTVNKLQKDIVLPPSPATIPVKGGRIPFRTNYHGFGRVDAYEAVKEAKRLKENADLLDNLNNPAPIYDWNLIIRDNLNDDGIQATTGTIDSPDIGIGHTQIFPVVNYNVVVTHQNPIANKDRYIFVRIKNIGTDFCLDADLKIFLKTDTSSTPNFDFPAAWQNPIDPNKPIDLIKKIIGNSNSNLYVFDTEIKDMFNNNFKEINEGDIQSNGDRIFRAKWPKKYIPPRDSNLNTFLMVMISPFAGKRADAQVAGNSSLTYKQVQIVDLVLFKNSQGNLLDKEIQLSAYASPLNKTFAIEINSPTPFDADDVEITIKRKNRNNPTDKVIFKRILGVWQFENNATPNWISFANNNTANPSGTISNPTTLTGSFFIGPEQKYIEMKVEVGGSTSPLPFNERHRMKVKITDLPEGTGFANDSGARIHFFTVADANVFNNQPASDPFGPFIDSLQPTKDFFRLTSKHTATGTAKAYAVCNGVVAVQEDSINNNLINLILKPLQQPALNFAPIKYFIYKGIKKSSLFSGTDITAKPTNRLTETLWQSAENRLQSVTTKNAALNPPLPVPVQSDFTPPPNKTLGVHLTASLNSSLYGDDKPIDNLFFKGDVDFQLPIVYGGWDIGEFESAGFGFEIVFENVNYFPTLDKVRKLENIVEVDKLTGTEPGDVKFENRLKREEVINYMDPSSFFGSLYGNRLFVMPPGNNNLNLVSTGDFDKKKGNDIYLDALKNRFANLNRTYIDIRNEHGFSFNFYENYGDDITIVFSKDGALLERNFYESNWPLLIIENTEFVGGNTSSKNIIELSLPTLADLSTQTAENKLPLAYISQGYLSNAFLKNVRGNSRFLTLTVNEDSGDILSKYTKEKISLAIPNDSAENDTTVVSSYIRIKYLKRLEQLPSSPPTSLGIILRGAHYLDNLLVPIGMQLPFSSNAKIKSVVFDEEVYIDGTFIPSVELDGIGKIGLGEDDNGNVTLFVFITDLHDKNGTIRSTFAISGETRNEDGDLLTQVTKKESHLTLAKAALNINNSSVPYILLEETSSGFANFEKVDPREFFGFLITKIEFTTILSLAQDLNNFSSDKMPVFIAFEKVTVDISPHGTTDTGAPFTRYEIVLRGHKKFGTAYQVVQVNTNVIIYTNGNL